MSSRVAQASLSIVAIIVGVLLVGQLRSQAPAIELSSLSANELSDLIETLRAGNAQLSAQLSQLRGDVEDYERLAVQGQSQLTLNSEELIRLEAFAGLRAVEGQGIVMDIQARFTPTNVNDLIHELRSAGAEAISIDGVRITASSVAVQGAGAIEIDGEEVGNSLQLIAIGSPDGLAAALERPGGVLAVFEQSIEASYRIEPREYVVVSATERDLAPEAAQPVRPVE